jgi:hypothetical protein
LALVEREVRFVVRLVSAMFPAPCPAGPTAEPMAAERVKAAKHAGPGGARTGDFVRHKHHDSANVSRLWADAIGGARSS